MSANFPESFGQSDTAGESEDDPTRDELYERAQELDIEGRSSMDKDELEVAVAEAEAEQGPQTAAAEDRPRATRNDTSEEGRATAADAGAVLSASNPDYSPTREGYVGVDPIYQNASDHRRRPAVDGQVEGAPDGDSTSDEE